MLNMIRGEKLKYNRSFSKKLVIIAPLFFIIYGLITIKQINSQYNYFEYTVFNWWPLLFMPMGITLISSLSAHREKKAGRYIGLFSHDISKYNMWLSKVGVIALYVLISTVELIGVLILLKIIIPNSITSIGNAIKASIVIWVTSLSFIPIALFLAEKFGMVVSIIVNILGIVAGVICATEPSWIFIPWSWAMRLMCPIVKVHPNGIPLEPNSYLLDSTVIFKGIVVSILAFIILSLLTGIWFRNKED